MQPWHFTVALIIVGFIAVAALMWRAARKPK
ncbi:hypothetical protein EV386_0565 [Xylanimonas ulmi]|uniref:Uncharacterized protein n=1 Tax=Xylanimonas ulmi TaxID=228973 RepID=A0A4Q7M0C5_9MICO|nr:hypothetical protein EV386_0565 [Xylanibacterium ulmi]